MFLRYVSKKPTNAYKCNYIRKAQESTCNCKKAPARAEIRPDTFDHFLRSTPSGAKQGTP